MLFRSEVRKSPLSLTGIPVRSGDQLSDLDRISNGKAPRFHTRHRSRSDTHSRSDAIALLALLQKEAGFVDLVYESLEDLTDQQVGQLARPVLDATHRCLHECLQLQTIVNQNEGETIRVPKAISPNRWKIVGELETESGRVIHPGWIATKLELPRWKGSEENALVISQVKVDTSLPILLPDSASIAE